MQEQLHNHVQNLDLHGNNIVYECVVLKEFENGDVAFIQLNELDRIDLDRLREIVTRRGAQRSPLWDLMNMTTLRNGENALTYFHQMTRIKTSGGEIITPMSGQRGAAGVKLGKKPVGRPPKNA